MKKAFIFIIAAIMFSSCATFVPQQRTVLKAFTDYRPYTSEGFFLSPDAYPGSYESIGQLEMIVYPEQIKVKPSETQKFPDAIYYGLEMYAYEKVNYSELLEMAVSDAVKVGANGISHLHISKTTPVGTGTPYYTVQGLCIKINK